MEPALRAGKRALPVGALALALVALAGPGCAVLRCRPPAPPRPAPGYERLRDTLATVDASGLAGRRIALDPGHGGFFRGALGVGGLTEAEVNLGVALALRDRLVAHGADVLLTREGDRDFLGPADSSLSADLAERARRAAAFDPDLLVSIHHNADARGAHDVNETQTYYKLGDEGPSLDAAQDVHRALVRNVGIRANRVVPGNYYMLRSSAAPALLTETSYITNPDVEKRLRRPREAGAGGRRAVHRPGALLRAKGAGDRGVRGGQLPRRPPDSRSGHRGAALRATVRGPFDRVRMTVDGRRSRRCARARGSTGRRPGRSPAARTGRRCRSRSPARARPARGAWTSRSTRRPGPSSASLPRPGHRRDGRQPLGLELRAPTSRVALRRLA